MTNKRFERIVEFAELRIKILQSTFVHVGKECNDIYKKRMRQLEFAEKFKKHKLIFN